MADLPRRKRQVHKKSRNGCCECKRKRNKVRTGSRPIQALSPFEETLTQPKCDECHPTCGNCARFGVECSYNKNQSHPGGLAVRSQSPSPYSATSQAQTPDLRISLIRPSAFIPWTISSSLDTELLTFFFMDCMYDLLACRERSLRDAYNLFSLVLSNGYVMQEALSVSALKPFAEAPGRTELLTVASLHQEEALKLAQPVIGCVTEESSIGILFFSSFAAVSSLAAAALNPLESIVGGPDPIDRMTHSIGLSRGIITLIRPHWPYIRSSWAWPMLKDRIEAGADMDTNERDLPAYWSLRALTLGMDKRDEREACLSAVEHTFQFISLLQQSSDLQLSQRLATQWPLERDPIYVQLLTDRKPVALVILAYYAAILSMTIGLWWVADLPSKLVLHIEAHLGKEWAELLHWPKHKVLGSTRTRQNASM